MKETNMYGFKVIDKKKFYTPNKGSFTFKAFDSFQQLV